MIGTRRWRVNRDRAGILLGLVLEAGGTEEAWEIYKQWAGAQMPYRRAKRLLRSLSRKQGHGRLGMSARK